MQEKNTIKEQIKNTKKDKNLRIAKRLKLRISIGNRIGSTSVDGGSGCC